MHVIRGENLRDLYFKANRYFFDKNDYDYKKSSVTAHGFNVMMKAESACGYLDLVEMGYTRKKWAALLKLYFDQEEWNMFIARLVHYRYENKRYVVDLAFQVKERKNRSGSCLQSLVIGYSESTGWRLTVFSRASEITLRWYADLAFLEVFLEAVCQYIDAEPADFSVMWYASSIYQSITSMPLVLLLHDQEYGTSYKENILEADPETLEGWQKATNLRFQKSYSEDGKYHSFKTQKRPVDAYRQMMGEDLGLEKVPATSLKLPAANIDNYGEDFFSKGGMR